jgi:hypothetical protein
MKSDEEEVSAMSQKAALNFNVLSSSGKFI